MKSKQVAAVLAIIFGVFGLHRFYLGQRWLGMMYFGFTMFAFIMTITKGVPIIAIAGIIALMDAILLAVMPQTDFDARYNKKKKRESYQSRRAVHIKNERDNKKRQSQNFQTLKRKGIEAYRRGYLEDAIAYFNDALDVKLEDPAIHFNLACCHSRLEESIDAFYHLEKAVEHGFDDLEKIKTHKALAYLRTLEDFDLFIANDYQSQPLDLQELDKEDDLLEQLNQKQSQELLDKLQELAALRDKGILTKDEFEEQKRRLLNE